jgi:hypothetical protein
MKPRRELPLQETVAAARNRGLPLIFNSTTIIEHSL